MGGREGTVLLAARDIATRVRTRVAPAQRSSLPVSSFRVPICSYLSLSVPSPSLTHPCRQLASRPAHTPSPLPRRPLPSCRPPGVQHQPLQQRLQQQQAQGEQTQTVVIVCPAGVSPGMQVQVRVPARGSQRHR